MAEVGAGSDRESSGWRAMLVVFALVVVLASVLYRRFWKRGLMNMPPGPAGLPILGNLLQTKSPVTHLVMLEMGKKWGPVATIWSGLKPVILITGAREAHEALIEKGTVFASRAKLQSRLNFTGWRSVNSALYGPYWRAIRKNLVTQVTSSAKVASFAPFREEELSILLKRIQAEANERDGLVHLLPRLRFAVFSILFHICFGKRFEESTVHNLEKVLRRLLVLLSPQILDFIPIVHRMSKRHRNECQAHLKVLRDTFSPFFEQHRQDRAKGIYTGDYVDSLLDLEKQVNLSETDMLGLIGEVLTAGSDTTAGTLEWTVALLVANPEKQKKLYEEIVSVVGHQLVQETDLEKMPYLHAVVNESLRRYPPLPFGITHGVTEQTTVGGYDVPANALVLVHYYAIANDPTIWKHPELFIPERWFDPDLVRNYDITGTKILQSSPFGAGRRICPGMNLGLTHVHLILARVIQEFEMSAADPEKGIDFQEKLEFTNILANPLHVRMKSRTL